VRIPIIPVTIAGEAFRLFFNTGAQVSYLQDDLLDTFPSAGVMQDFYPGFASLRRRPTTCRSHWVR